MRAVVNNLLLCTGSSRWTVDVSGSASYEISQQPLETAYGTYDAYEALDLN